MTVDVRFRNRLRAQCRLNEFAGFVEVWVYNEYAIPGLGWKSVRTIVDVGANVGAATLWFASHAPGARIVAVEPAPIVLPTLRNNVERNGLEDRVQIVSKALGATPGVGFLTSEEDSTRTSVTVDPRRSSSAVPVESLEGLLEETGIETLDLLKLDCEGAEFDILRASAQSTLSSIRAIVGEFHATTTNRRSDIENVLVRSGFDCEFVGPEHSGLFAAIQREN